MSSGVIFILLLFPGLVTRPWRRLGGVFLRRGRWRQTVRCAKEHAFERRVRLTTGGLMPEGEDEWRCPICMGSEGGFNSERIVTDNFAARTAEVLRFGRYSS